MSRSPQRARSRFWTLKAFEEETPVTDISQSPTLTEEMTRAGVILGTAAYMSPEQAKGKPVDKRADIFAFGAVLYELLTGKRAFEGETITETIAAVLKSEPDWGKLPRDTPWRIRDLLGRCLQKAVHDRLDGIANVRIEINMALEEPATASPIGVGGTAQPARRQWRLTIGVIVLTAVVTSLAIWTLMPSSSLAPQPVTRFIITPPSTAPLGNSRSNDLALSPDGEQVVYAALNQGTRQLYVRSMDGLEARPISGTEGVRRSFFFSPDSQSVVFVTQNKLKKISLLGGAPMTLSDARSQEGGSWGSGDTIVFAEGTSAALYRVSANGGQVELLAEPDPAKGERAYQHPEILPGGKAVLFDIYPNYRTALLSLETGHYEILLEGSRNPHYVPTGHLVYELAMTGTLMAAPFDLERLEVTGSAVPILEGVSNALGPGEADYAFSANGSLVYIGGGSGGRTVIWVDREGNSEPLLDTPSGYRLPHLSPDGQGLVLADEAKLVVS